MNVHWDDMRYFMAVSRHHSFVAAARELRVTHTTVARRISALESVLKTRLFVRSEKGCMLTPAGEMLLPYGEQMESTILNITDQISGEDELLSGSIRIGAPDGFGTFFLAQCLNELQVIHPLLDIELIAIPMYYSLSKREIDILVTVQKPPQGRVVARMLTNYRLGLFSSESYLQDRPAVSNKRDLRNHRIVGYIDDLLFDQDLDFMQDILPGLTANFRSSTVVAQMHAVAAGAGIGVVPYFMARKEPDLIHVLQDIFVEKAYWLQINPDSQELARVRTTIEFIVEKTRQNQRMFKTMSKVSNVNNPNFSR